MKIPFILAVFLLSTYPTEGKYTYYPNHADLRSNIRPGKLLLNTCSSYFNLMLSFEVQRLRLLEVPSFTTETRTRKNKIQALSWAASMIRENEGHGNNYALQDIFWKVLYDVFEVEVGQQRTGKSLQLLNLLIYQILLIFKHCAIHNNVCSCILPIVIVLLVKVPRKV